MKTIRRLSAIIIGFVLFISGALKLMDPVGAGLVMDEYFSFLHLGFMGFASGFFGVVFALCETILGIALITGVWRKVVAFVSLCFLGLFTLLTAILWIFNPPMDCGCFGEAIKLTHAQSFIKNCILMALWALAFIPVREQEPTRKIKYLSFSIASISSCLFLLYSSFSIPLMDFTSLKTGTELYCEDNIDFEEVDDFTKLHELYPVLSISNVAGEAVDSLVLSGNVLVASVHTPQKMSESKWAKLTSVLNMAHESGYSTILLAAATPEELETLVRDPELLSYSYFADRKDLLSLNRSNGGISFISDAQIIAKWSINRTPTKEKLTELTQINSTEALIAENNSSSLKMQAFLLYVFAVMLLL